jgi:hypothetical protein
LHYYSIAYSVTRAGIKYYGVCDSEILEEVEEWSGVEWSGVEWRGEGK